MIKKVGVVGAGMMGAEIALCFARAGYETVLSDVNQELADNGKVKSSLLGWNIADIGYPFLIRSVSVKITIQQIRIGSCFLAAMNESFAANLRQQTIFMHDTPNGLVVIMLTVLTLDPKLDPTTAVRAHILPTITTCLNLFHQKRFPIQLFASLSEAVISAA